MTEPIEARTLPHNIDAERAVLGAILLHSDALFDVAAVVSEADFFREAHRVIYRHILALHEAKVAIDFVPLRESLSQAGVLDGIGGPTYLTSLVDGMPRSVNAVDYARIVREKAAYRSIIFDAHKTLAEAYESEFSASDVLNAAQARLFAIADRQAPGGFVDMATLMPDVMNEVEKRYAEKRVVTGVPTGFVDLDQMTSGLQREDLIIIAGRPSMGKTSLAMNIAEFVGIRTAHRVGVFSLEMGRASLGMRLLASEARVDHHKLRSGFLSGDDMQRIGGAMQRLAEAGIAIDDSSSVTPWDIRAKARRLQADRGLDLIIIDYLQLMTGAKSENKNLEVAGITKALKAIARDLHVPLVLLSQLSRENERRGDKRPQLSDLRDSGAIEQDADVVMFVHREEKYNETDDNRGIAEIIVSKQRNGPIGPVRLAFIDHLVRFDNLDRQHTSAPPSEQRMPYAEAHE
jgi:replicative DNA helicase